MRHFIQHDRNSNNEIINPFCLLLNKEYLSAFYYSEICVLYFYLTNGCRDNRGDIRHTPKSLKILSIHVRTHVLMACRKTRDNPVIILRIMVVCFAVETH